MSKPQLCDWPAIAARLDRALAQKIATEAHAFVSTAGRERQNARRRLERAIRKLDPNPAEFVWLWAAVVASAKTGVAA